MNDVLNQIFATSTVRTEAGDCIPLHSNISVEQGSFLQSIIRERRPVRSLEIGCAYGISTLFICEALKEIHASDHIVIDPNQSSRWGNTGLANLTRAGLRDIVTLHEERSSRCLPRLEAEGHKIDFAFIDGMHTFDYALVDFFYIDKMLNVGGVVVFDDVGYPSIRSLCRYILTNLAYVAVGPPVTPRRAWLPRFWQKPTSDSDLGIGSAWFLAMQKQANDLIGNGPEFTRHWTSHSAF